MIININKKFSLASSTRTYYIKISLILLYVLYCYKLTIGPDVDHTLQPRCELNNLVTFLALFPFKPTSLMVKFSLVITSA